MISSIYYYNLLKIYRREILEIIFFIYMISEIRLKKMFISLKFKFCVTANCDAYCDNYIEV